MKKIILKINQDNFEDIDFPKTNREELQQLEEKKKRN